MLTIAEFLKRLRVANVLDDERISAIAARCEQPHVDPTGFIRTVVEDGLITNYQAQELREGRGKNLRVGQYIIEEELGKGSFGIVFRGWHPQMQRPVAIKMLRSRKSRNRIKRFQSEVVALANLRHENIVIAYDAGWAEDREFLVMEYVPGQDLASYVRDHGPLKVERAVDYIRQAARGLAVAHAQEIVHRDVKPANLLLTDQGVVKVLDLGIAKLGETFGNRGKLTSSQRPIGTAEYIAPEQADNPRTADARSDVYSLGISLHELLTGQVAYPGGSPTARIVAHVVKPIPDVRDLAPHVPEWLQTVFEQMVAKDPDDRLPSMNAVIAKLAAGPAAQLPPPPTLPPPPRGDSKGGAQFNSDARQEFEFPRGSARSHCSGPPAKRVLRPYRAIGIASVLVLIAIAAGLAIMPGRTNLPSVEQQFQLGLAAYRRAEHEQVIAELESLAESGDPKSKYLVGRSYVYSRGTSQDPDAAKWLKQAFESLPAEAEAGDVYAQVYLGKMYFSGLATARDEVLARTWFQRARDGLQRLAEGGDVDAQSELGFVILNDGIDTNDAESVSWLTTAAEAGHGLAQGNLAYCRFNGIGGTTDAEGAVDLLREAASQGHAGAQTSLGGCYEFGYGVDPNSVEAWKWYLLGAEQGDARAQTNLGRIYQNGLGTIPKDPESAFRWYQQAAEQGYAPAEASLAICFEDGIGVEPDRETAVAWYRKAADQGNPMSQNNLGVCYQYGEGVDEDSTKAVAWYTKAAEQGDATAQFNLGLCYENGTGVTSDVGTAIDWYRKAAAQESAQAKTALTRLEKKPTAPFLPPPAVPSPPRTAE